MNYIIDNRVQINKSGMRPTGTHEPEIVLTATPMRLLTCLLENPNRILSREELFKFIWEERGLTPSGTSLSQYLSVLRKSFQRYGFDDSIIENIPKEGIRFNAHVLCIPDITIPEKKFSLSSVGNYLVYVLKMIRKKSCRVIIALLITAVALYLTFSKFTSFSDLSYAEWTKLDYISQCEVYLPVGEMNGKVREIYTERATAMIKKLRITCSPNDKVLVFLQNPLNNFNHSTTREREFITHCTSLKDSNYCYSYYFLHGGDL